MSTASPLPLDFPTLPAKHDNFLKYVAAHPRKPLAELLQPYKDYDAELRKAFAQHPGHTAVKQSNLVPIFVGEEHHVTIRARDLTAETEAQRNCYIMPLKNQDRKTDGAPAIVKSFKDYQTNFNVFSESSLADLDWSNVVVAGSAVVTSLLSVPEQHATSKRALRKYYHDQLAPASDVDLFLYGLTDEQATEKIKQIEQNVRDALLVETTTVRTKNAITIASKHPVRHVQIVLRIYKSISEILTGFDVDCSCAAYDGRQVYASPRALISYMTQINTIDLTRRSPSYENRLSKYAHRGFEIYWPELDRSRVDPTIFERSFGRTEGLARLLVLEKLPRSAERDAYLDQRRQERGRPPIDRIRSRAARGMLNGNIKDEHEDDVAEWMDEDVSDYHTIAIPYGPKFHARKIERLLFTKDMLLNAEWNKPKDREVNLHRHPAFFGSVDDVIGDCCGHCPQPRTLEEEEVAEEEGNKFIHGNVKFIKDDPGRQAIGSFNPIDAKGWTEMAYVGNTASLCQAIVDEDLDYVTAWLEREGNDPNTRDYTGRTPLHLAVANSSTAIVRALIDRGARLIARLADGRTALHLAAMRGNVEMVSMLLRKSAANEEENEGKIDARRAARKAAKAGKGGDVAMVDSDNNTSLPTGDASPSANEYDVEMVEQGDADTDMRDTTTEGSMVDIRKPHHSLENATAAGNDEDEPDIYDVNVTAWDTAVSPLHLAIAQGHVDVVRCLVQDFGADLLLPIKLFNDYDKSARAAILTLVLAMQLEFGKAQEMAKTLLSLGASTAQADVDHRTSLHFCVAGMPDLLDTLLEFDATGVKRAVNHLAVFGSTYRPNMESALDVAIQAKNAKAAKRLLASGAKASIDFSSYIRTYGARCKLWGDSKRNKEDFQDRVKQPIFRAIDVDLPGLAKTMVLDHGVDANSISTEGWGVIHNEWQRNSYTGTTLLDVVRDRMDQLREWTFEPGIATPPSPIQEDSVYLANFAEATYSYYTAKQQIEVARHNFDLDLKVYNEQMNEAAQRRGPEEKQHAIDELLQEYKDLESSLLQQGAKTFYDLHPDIKAPRNGSRGGNYSSKSPGQKEFAVHFDFQLGDLTDADRDRYVLLFEAAWKGDFEVLKNLTTDPWRDAEGGKRPPLKVAVQDSFGLSPFAIAVLQGHQEFALAALEIAAEQHVKPEPAKQRKYGIEDDGESDSQSDAESDDEVNLHSEVVDAEFTREDVGQVSLRATNRVTPLTTLLWQSGRIADWRTNPEPEPEKKQSTGFSYFGPRRPHVLATRTADTGRVSLPPDVLSGRYEAKSISPPQTLLQLSLHNNTLPLLNWLLDTAQKYSEKSTSGDEGSSTTVFELPSADCNYALEVGRPSLFSELARRTGAGLALNEMAEKHGIKLQQNAKYYQGLTVHGTKRKDWAAKEGHVMATSSAQKPPLLETIDHGSLELVEWWLSDAPLRCYREFAEANQGDTRILRLAQSDMGFEGAICKSLSTRSHIALHCAVAAPPSQESMKLLHYLVEVMPERIETKNCTGMRPLHVAFAMYQEGAAKLLIQSGADQTCRDNNGRNLVHSLLERNPKSAAEKTALKAMLELIDKRLIHEMFLQRAGSHTPLASWLYRHLVLSEEHEETLRIILSYSGGKDLGLINGEGDTPLHSAVKQEDTRLVRILLDHDPQLLLRENATGRTPYEMAEDACIASMCNEPPPMPGSWSGYAPRRARRYQLPGHYQVPVHWHEDILRKSESDFAPDHQSPEASPENDVWTVLQATRARLQEDGKARRRLVTLGEANEVARRLAGMKKSGDFGGPRRIRMARLGRGMRFGSLGSSEDYESGAMDEVQALMGRRIFVDE